MVCRGEHIHHGYYPTTESKANDTKEIAQVSLIKLLLETAQLPLPPVTSPVKPALNILDVGCGIGGTSRYLAKELGATVTGITISTKQVEMARRLTKSAAAKDTSETSSVPSDEAGPMSLGSHGGRVSFLELDAEKMGEVFVKDSDKFDVVWISEALSHFPNKPLFFQNAKKVLKEGGKLVIADWFKGADVKEGDADIKAIEDGMLLPPLCTQAQYVGMARRNDLQVVSGPKDISADVAQTW